MKSTIYAVVLVALLLSTAALWLEAHPSPQAGPNQSSGITPTSESNSQARPNKPMDKPAVPADLRRSPTASGVQPVLGIPTATPAYLTSDTNTIVTFSASITDPSLISGSVTLLRLSDTDGSTSVMATMTPTGNSTFVAAAALNVPAGKAVAVEVSAAFTGMLKRSISPPLTVMSVSPTSSSFSTPGLPASIHYPDNFVTITSSTSANFSSSPSLASGGMDAGGGCSIDESLDPNTQHLSLADWIALHWRTDGVNTPIAVPGLVGITKAFVDDITGDPATMTAVVTQAGIYTFSTSGASCNAVLAQMLSTSNFN